MKILHVIRGLANSSGTTHIVGPLAEAQAKLGQQVSVYFVDKPGEAAVVPDPVLVDSRCFPMTVRSRHYGWSRPFRAALRQQTRSFDVVHIHAIWNYPTWSAMREALRAGVPYLVAPQGSLEDWALGRSRYLKGLYAALFEKPLFDRAAGIQALTAAEAEQCRAYGIKSPAMILANGVDLPRIDASGQPADLRAEFGLPQDERLLLFLGRLFPKKGLDILIAALGQLIGTRDDITLLIAGHDAGTGYEHEVRTMLAACGVVHKARFLGELHGDRKFQVLRGVDAFALTSYSEGLPIAVLEAMAAARPVIVTPGCNIPEVKEHAAGWICEPDAPACAQTLQQAFEHEQELRRRGQNARRLIEQRFTWDRIAQSSLEIYHRMSGQHNNPEDPGQGNASRE
jgi:glycosyltransferase involved in cell wall biosynthesis